MVDVRELKIGNYVYLQNSKTPYKITEIGYSEIEYPKYEASGISSEAVFRTYVAVSYTHLDVYKRQILCRLLCQH